MISLALRIARFGVVGLSAAAVHFCIVVLLVQQLQYAPLVANVFAFFLSFQVSYFGHRFWTFRETTALHRDAMPRLLLVQLINLAANEALFYLLLLLHLPYQFALILVLAILPFFTFFANRFWVFRARPDYSAK